MSNFHPEDFELILELIKYKLSNNIDFEQIRSIESNFDTKGMTFSRKSQETSDGTIFVGEDNDLIVVDISKANGEVVSFIIKDKEDSDGINNVASWISENYKQ